MRKLERLENWGSFSPFLGTFWAAPAKWPKSALKVIRSFSNFACHHFIAKGSCPQNLRKIGEVRYFGSTFSVEWPYTVCLRSFDTFYIVIILLYKMGQELLHNSMDWIHNWSEIKTINWANQFRNLSNTFRDFIIIVLFMFW